MILIGLVIIAIAFYFRPSLAAYKKKSPDQTLTLYGSDTCGWCKKQLAELDGYEINYINCKEHPDKCKVKGITAYPTWVLPDGSQLKGFQTKDKMMPYLNAPVGK